MGCWWSSTQSQARAIGQFIDDCPHCGTKTHWTKYQIIESEKCYSVLPCGTKDKGEFVQCNICGARYATRPAEGGCCSWSPSSGSTMCNWPNISKYSIEYFILNNRFKGLTNFFLKIFFQYVRTMQILNISKSIDDGLYIVDNCDCRFNKMNCNKRIDTCFKQNKKGKNLSERIKSLDSERLVRIYVNNGGFKKEICHCCNCCCIPIIIQSYSEEQLIHGSGYLPEIQFESCINCGECKSICPFYAIYEDLSVDTKKCLGCGLCWKNCQESAIKMKRRNEDDVIKVPNRLFSFVFSIIFYSYFFLLQKLYFKYIS